MNYFKMVYHVAAVVAFVTIINDVLILRWHRWDRHLFNVLPIGEWIGWFEIVFFAIMACVASWFIIELVIYPQAKKEAKK